MSSGARHATLALLCFALGFGAAAVVRRSSAEEASDATVRAPGGASPSAAPTGGAARKRPLSPALQREAERQFQGAYARFLAGHLAEAVELAEKAAKVDASDPRPMHLQGKCYQAMFLAERAEAAFRAAVERDPTFLESAKELSIVLHDAGRFREAADLLERLLVLHPQNTLLRAELAVNLLRLGEPRRALELLESYRAAVGEDDAWTRLQIGRALADLGETERAETELRAALARDPAMSTACHALGRLLVASGREPEAKPWLERYRKLRELESEEHQLRMRLLERPDDVPVLVRVAQVLFERGRREEALQMLERARRVAPDDAALEKLHRNVSGAVGGSR